MNTHERSSGLAPHPPKAAAAGGELERWEVDASASRFAFSLRHLVVHQITGTFRDWGGTLYLNRAQPALSSVYVWVDLASVDTGSAERDDHLRSEELLDVAHEPRAELKSTSVEVREHGVVLRGRLELHGVTRDLELDVVPRADPEGNAYVARGRLDRQAFGLHWNQDLDVGGFVVGDEVELAVEVKLVRAEDDVKGNA